MPEQFQPIQVVGKGKETTFDINFNKSQLGKEGQDVVNLEFIFDSKRTEIKKMLDTFKTSADKEHRPWYWKDQEKFKQALEAYAEKVNTLLKSFVPKIKEIYEKNPHLVDSMAGSNTDRIKGVVSKMGPDFNYHVLLSMNNSIDNIVKNPGNALAKILTGKKRDEQIAQNTN